MSAQNSNEVEWNDASIAANGAQITKVTDWAFRKVKDLRFLHSASSDPTEIEGNLNTYVGTFGFRRNAIVDLRRAAQAAGAQDITEVVWVISVDYRARGSRLLQTHTLLGLRFEEDPDMHSNQGNQTISIPAKFLKKIST